MTPDPKSLAVLDDCLLGLGLDRATLADALNGEYRRVLDDIARFPGNPRGEHSANDRDKATAQRLWDHLAVLSPEWGERQLVADRLLAQAEEARRGLSASREDLVGVPSGFYGVRENVLETRITAQANASALTFRQASDSRGMEVVEDEADAENDRRAYPEIHGPPQLLPDRHP